MITWKVKIKVLNIERKEVSVKAVRTDDTDPENPKIYEIPWTEIATPEQKTAAINQIWSMHQAKIAYDSQVAAILGALESQAEQTLQNKEGV